MSTARRLKRLRGRNDHAQAMAEVGLWENGLQQHWHVTVRRLGMAGVPRKRAELMAFKMIVASLSGMDLGEAAEGIAQD